ncbi:hypothetical protein PsorP6_014047 [Peronosclerospora sorghi]|uniref:Uncharacterized protein n=1 Tax=Peronosclerospora sorghi TaxID=230839 RepID=A0ACC0VIE6_9STRA|nr:hypothetical protein PsorP6_014047 [Peronosclerospora sorghi]
MYAYSNAMPSSRAHFQFVLLHLKSILHYKMKASTPFLALASLVTNVFGHGYVSHPPCPFKQNLVNTSYVTRITASINPAFANGKWDGTPEDNVKLFTERWNATGYKSLGEMVDGVVPDCGNTLETAEPVDVTGYTEMWWQNDQYKVGFAESHKGPCSVKVAGQQVFHSHNCGDEFPGYPAKLPVDYSPCKGECLLVFYWLALHEANWQVYKNCVPIKNNRSSISTTTEQNDTTASSDHGNLSGEQSAHVPAMRSAITTATPTATTNPADSTTSVPLDTPEGKLNGSANCYHI